MRRMLVGIGIVLLAVSCDSAVVATNATTAIGLSGLAFELIDKIAAIFGVGA